MSGTVTMGREGTMGCKLQTPIVSKLLLAHARFWTDYGTLLETKLKRWERQADVLKNTNLNWKQRLKDPSVAEGTTHSSIGTC